MTGSFWEKATNLRFSWKSYKLKKVNKALFIYAHGRRKISRFFSHINLVFVISELRNPYSARARQNKKKVTQTLLFICIEVPQKIIRQHFPVNQLGIRDQRVEKSWHFHSQANWGEKKVKKLLFICID